MGWVIKNGDDSLYRTIEQGRPEWTEDYLQALHFSRRDDAEKFCAEDEDAWIIRFIPDDATHNAGFFNKLSPAEAERLWLLVEEMGEALLAIGKIGRHGYESSHPDAVAGDPNNRGDLQTELGHVYRAIKMLSQSGDISWEHLLTAAITKIVTMKPYLHHQQEGKKWELYR